MTYFDQSSYDIRCEWGLEGVQLLSPISDAVIIVDVISFTTSVAVAVGRGARVYPYVGSAEGVEDFARSKNAILAQHRGADPDAFTLAPSSLLRLNPGDSLVLPSPNGSTLSLATGDTPTFAGCLRNARAVAESAAKLGRRVSVIPSGERWPGSSRSERLLRPGLEDQLGAGAIIHHLPGTKSPEAEAAEAVFLHFQHNLLAALRACSSGREAEDRGSLRDLELMAEWNVDQTAPHLIDGAYQAA